MTLDTWRMIIESLYIIAMTIIVMYSGNWLLYFAFPAVLYLGSKIERLNE